MSRREELEAAAASGDRDREALARVELALLHRDAGRPDLAEAELLRVIQSGHDGQAPRAAFELACMYESHGDVEGARAAYRCVLEHDAAAYAGPAVCAIRRLRH